MIKLDKKTFAIILLIVAVAALSIQLMSSARRIERMKRDALTEKTITDFKVRTLEEGGVMFDKVQVINDSIAFLKGDSLLGSAVIQFED